MSILGVDFSENGARTSKAVNPKISPCYGFQICRIFLPAAYQLINRVESD